MVSVPVFTITIDGPGWPCQPVVPSGASVAFTTATSVSRLASIFRPMLSSWVRNWPAAPRACSSEVSPLGGVASATPATPGARAPHTSRAAVLFLMASSRQHTRSGHAKAVPGRLDEDSMKLRELHDERAPLLGHAVAGAAHRLDDHRAIAELVAERAHGGIDDV